jgi:hypothetical protein
MATLIKMKRKIKWRIGFFGTWENKSADGVIKFGQNK